MRITQEADYAIRITYCLAMSKDKVRAKTISENTGVPLRFALKILRKLIFADIIISFKGVNGGYKINKPLDKVSFGEIIEVIDGPIAINHCLENEFLCTRVSNKETCNFHMVFDSINTRIKNDLYCVTMDRFIKNDLEL